MFRTLWDYCDFFWWIWCILSWLWTMNCTYNDNLLAVASSVSSRVSLFVVLETLCVSLNLSSCIGLNPGWDVHTAHPLFGPGCDISRSVMWCVNGWDQLRAVSNKECVLCVCSDKSRHVISIESVTEQRGGTGSKTRADLKEVDQFNQTDDSSDGDRVDEKESDITIVRNFSVPTAAYDRLSGETLPDPDVSVFVSGGVRSLKGLSVFYKSQQL